MDIRNQSLYRTLVHSHYKQELIDTTTSASIGTAHTTGASGLYQSALYSSTQTSKENKRTFSPGLLVKLPFNFIIAPEILSPILGLRR